MNPAVDSDGSDEPCCGCEFCQGYSAAIALHTGLANCHAVASFDADLQRVIAAWGTLPEPMRQAIMALVGTIAARPNGSSMRDKHHRPELDEIAKRPALQTSDANGGLSTFKNQR